MSGWAPVPRSNAGEAEWNGGSANDKWNAGPTKDTWNDNAGGNGGDAAASFDERDANGFDAGGGGGNGACFNCGQEGHNKADCPNPRVLKCRHCNEEGHIVRDCPTAPLHEFTGECYHCHQEGHMAKDCPTKPAEVCRNCQQEGHPATECENARKVDRSHVEEVNAEVAWNRISEAVQERDIDDVKEAIQQYVKACPETTYAELESAFRSQDIGVYLIAMESQSMISTLTNMDLQGNLNKKYRVNYRFDPKPTRPRERELWPSVDENLERLADADDRAIARVDTRLLIVSPEPRVAGPDVECRKCGETGHFSRDCPQGGGDGPRGCFNCGQEGHSARDCTEPKKIICRNCNQEGHTSRDCTEPKDMSKVQCRNCDEYGHGSRECPKPRDYSRVQCQNCGEMGHTKVRCKKETVAPDTFDGGNDGVATGGGFGEGAGDPASSDWMKEAATNAGSRVNNEWDAPVTGGQSAW